MQAGRDCDIPRNQGKRTRPHSLPVTLVSSVTEITIVMLVSVFPTLIWASHRLGDPSPEDPTSLADPTSSCTPWCDDQTLHTRSGSQAQHRHKMLPSQSKHQCFEHGCNGRQFSTFSNLLRHQREKNGTTPKVMCAVCGTEFTRTTARNSHMLGGHCKGRESEGKSGADELAPKERAR